MGEGKMGADTERDRETDRQTVCTPTPGRCHRSPPQAGCDSTWPLSTLLTFHRKKKKTQPNNQTLLHSLYVHRLASPGALRGARPFPSAWRVASMALLRGSLMAALRGRPSCVVLMASLITQDLCGTKRLHGARLG